MSNPKVGQIWKILHCRKGIFTAKIISFPPSGFMDVEIISGHLHYASAINNFCQSMFDKGMPGARETMRISLCRFIQKIK